MLNRVRRRIAQVRQIGVVAACRVASGRTARGVHHVIDGISAGIRPTGLTSIGRERPPGRILPSLPGAATPGLIGSAASGSFELLGARLVGGSAFASPADFPRPWRRHSAAILPVVGKDHRSIDWQADPSSGFRWSARIPARTIRYGEQVGVEVKWPWELGRLQHLPATARPALKRDSVDSRAATSLLVRHVADFVLSNPPGFGVQWICPMDVGIRIANILVAIDLARAAGADFDEAFLSMVSATARDHARHISRNLEWGDRLCSNHYLANIAGLLYVGAYLPDDQESSEWLAFAGREMVHQIRAQFHEEGSNFEASTCYHRLSAEMAIHSAALMLWISRNQPERAARWWSGRVRCFHPSPAAPPTPRVEWRSGLAHPFDESLCRRLFGMGRFTESILRPDGSIPQVGDNDSGRFMRLEMSDDPYADIDDHRHLVRASRALFGIEVGDGLESRWMARWLGDATLPTPEPKGTDHWPEFGLFVWRRPRILLTFRCGHVGQLGNGGHAHCDQLSITLTVDGRAFIDDPGTGVYTPRPEVRNELRSSACHSTVLVPGLEQGDWLPGRWGLFSMRDVARARMIRLDASGAVGEMFQGDALVRRSVEVKEAAVRLLDVAPRRSEANFVLAPGATVESVDSQSALLRSGSTTVRLVGVGIRIESCPWSRRYGDVGRTQRIRCSAGECTLEIMSEP